MEAPTSIAKGTVDPVREMVVWRSTREAIDELVATWNHNRVRHIDGRTIYLSIIEIGPGEIELMGGLSASEVAS